MLVSESNVVGSRLKGALHVMIVVVCEAGRRSTRATLVRLGRVTVGSALVVLTILTLGVPQGVYLFLVNGLSDYRRSWMRTRTNSACLSSTKVRWKPFITAPKTGGTPDEIGAWSSETAGNAFCWTP